MAGELTCCDAGQIGQRYRRHIRHRAGGVKAAVDEILLESGQFPVGQHLVEDVAIDAVNDEDHRALDGGHAGRH